ncbi:AraC family transcriptional regulator [Bacillus solitudinis]|uniref:AraC family transcriptional regulator n=1 Tax=Bacillus solitudinis TaxID=2014074 RepID=UPI000C245B62|nr:AraC family transcriptional regulator [Bacillus solitudinis]
MLIKKKAQGFSEQKLIVLPENVINQVSTHPLIRSLYLTDLGFFPNAEYHYREREAGSSTHIVIYCVKGEGWYQLNNQRKVYVQPNTLFVLPPNIAHTYGTTEKKPWSIYWFHLKGDRVPDYLENLQSFEQPLAISINKSHKLIDLFHECFHLLQRGYMLNNMIYVSQALAHFLGIVFYGNSQLQTHLSKSNSIEMSIQFMTDHLQQSFSLDELASHVNLSKSHYVHLFTKTTGYTPIDYFNRLKIQLASKYLDLTDLSIKEISTNIGIHDSYYFSRLFSKIMGQSPSKYRKNKKG